MANANTEDREAGYFPDNPLFAGATPDEVELWTWIVEDMESEQDDRLLDDLGITGEDRQKLKNHMVVSRMAFKGMISRGVGFEDPDFKKFPAMIATARKLAQEAIAQDPESGLGTTE